MTAQAPGDGLGLPLLVVSSERATAEQRLVVRLQAGELAALAEAYDEHHVHVRAFAQRLIGDDGAAEDLVQETFLALPRVVARFRGDASLRTLLLSIAINGARHHVRAAARRRAATARLAREPNPEASTPAEEVARAELAAALLRALDALSIEQRAVVVLCEVEGRTAVEAARIVGAPEATVRTRLFHARRKLSEALAREGFG
jgi:RNA polymerase sigma-70 factor (ECF subfamily)